VIASPSPPMVTRRLIQSCRRGVNVGPLESAPNGQYRIWLPRAVVDGLAPMRGARESYSDVILRLISSGQAGVERTVGAQSSQARHAVSPSRGSAPRTVRAISLLGEKLQRHNPEARDHTITPATSAPRTRSRCGRKHFVRRVRDEHSQLK
jgi:hypothetical protein